MTAKDLDAIGDFTALLRAMVHKDASDLFITAGVPPTLKIRGSIMPIGDAALKADQVRKVAMALMQPNQQDEFNKTLECNFAIEQEGIGRFRVNVLQQKNQVGLILRRIKNAIPGFKELRIPNTLAQLAMVKRGLVIIAGATGTGKSSTLAAMIGHRNRNTRGHIISVEDPIEYVHEHDGCIVTQREVGVDTQSFEAALRNTLRQAPDVILIGEVRSRKTMEHAIEFAETGHLCLTTMHANNANQALDRIINFFPEERRDQLLLDLSLNLKSIVAQQLIPTPDKKDRRVAVEILINTPLVGKLIHEGEFGKLKDVMSKSNQMGMKTFDQALYDLFKAGEISYDDALHHADSANDLRLMIKLGRKSESDNPSISMDGITLVNVDQNN